MELNEKLTVYWKSLLNIVEKITVLHSQGSAATVCSKVGTLIFFPVSSFFTMSIPYTISALVLLDLSAAFHTVDHDILVRRLETSYGLSNNDLVHIWIGAAMVPNVPGRPGPVRSNRIFGIVSDADRVRCTAGVGSRPYSVPVVHRRSDPVDPGSWSSPTSLRRRYTNIRVLSTVCVTEAAEHHLQLC